MSVESYHGIVEHLMRSSAWHEETSSIMREAAARIGCLERELEHIKDAVRPLVEHCYKDFADFEGSGELPDNEPVAGPNVKVTFGDVRKAMEVIK